MHNTKYGLSPDADRGPDFEKPWPIQTQKAAL